MNGARKGIDVLRFVKRQRPLTKVVALSHATTRKLRESYLEAGASAYFDKATQFLEARDWIAKTASLIQQEHSFLPEKAADSSPRV